MVVWAENLFATWLFAGEACQISAQNNPLLTLPFYVDGITFSKSHIWNRKSFVLFVFFSLRHDDDLLIKLVICRKLLWSSFTISHFDFVCKVGFDFGSVNTGWTCLRCRRQVIHSRICFPTFDAFFYLGSKKVQFELSIWRVQSFLDCCFVSNKVDIGYGCFVTNIQVFRIKYFFRFMYFTDINTNLQRHIRLSIIFLETRSCQMIRKSYAQYLRVTESHVEFTWSYFTCEQTLLHACQHP